MNKIYPNCNKEFSKNAKFCNTCGTEPIDKLKEIVSQLSIPAMVSLVGEGQ